VGVPPPLERLAAYRVVYRVTETTGPTPVVTTEVLDVRRPFEAREEERQGPLPGGDIQSGSVQNRDYFWELTGDQPEFGLRREPGVETRDASLDALRDAVRRHLAVDRGGGTVLGHACRRFSYLQFRPPPLSAPNHDEHIESCVSAEGIVLDEVWTLKGRVARTREAVELDTSPRFGPDVFFLGRLPDASSATGSLVASQTAVADGKLPSRGFLRPRLPEGFAVDRQATVTKVAGGNPVQYFAASYVRGSEVVVVLQGVTAAGGGALPWGVKEGQAVTVPRMPQARLVEFIDVVELRMWRPAANKDEGIEYFRVDAPSADLALYFGGTLSPA
jgi:hypothetical protein